MLKNTEIYIYLKNTVEVLENTPITVSMIAETWNTGETRLPVGSIKIGYFKESEYYKITALDMIKKIKKEFPDCTVHILGDTEVWIIKKVNKKENKLWLTIFKVSFVSILLFVGGGMAIMNFHADVNMPGVHRNIYYLITGKRSSKPYWVSIPYSIGIGVGIGIFFNHFALNQKKKDPSPLELELFSYQKNLDEYKREDSTKTHIEGNDNGL